MAAIREIKPDYETILIEQDNVLSDLLVFIEKLERKNIALEAIKMNMLNDQARSKQVISDMELIINKQKNDLADSQNIISELKKDKPTKTIVSKKSLDSNEDENLILELCKMDKNIIQLLDDMEILGDHIYEYIEGPKNNMIEVLNSSGILESQIEDYEKTYDNIGFLDDILDTEGKINEAVTEAVDNYDTLDEEFMVKEFRKLRSDISKGAVNLTFSQLAEMLQKLN